MSHIVELVPEHPFVAQLADDAGPIILLNLFRVAAADVEAFNAHWAVAATFMMSQPGFVSQQLHVLAGNETQYMNYGVWESASALRTVFVSAEFQAIRDGYPASAVATPAVFLAQAVPGACGALPMQPA